jgi:hypothetical protein
MEYLTKAGEATTKVVQAVTPNMASADNFIARNKQKLLGLGMITVSFLMADPTLKDDLNPKVFSWSVRILGILALWFGFLNNPEPKG